MTQKIVCSSPPAGGVSTFVSAVSGGRLRRIEQAQLALERDEFRDLLGRALFELVGEAHAERELAFQVVAGFDAGGRALAPGRAGPLGEGGGRVLVGVTSAGAITRCLIAGSMPG